MNQDEKIAKKYLETLGYKSIVFEPDGNQPPDFLVEDKIAVEVRKLNQMFDNGTTIIPLNDLYYKLIPKLKRIIDDFSAPNINLSSAVLITFSRPVSPNKKLGSELV